MKCAEKEEYISHLERERDSPAERFRKGLLMEGSFGAVALKEAFRDAERFIVEVTGKVPLQTKRQQFCCEVRWYHGQFVLRESWHFFACRQSEQRDSKAGMPALLWSMRTSPRLSDRRTRSECSCEAGSLHGKGKDKEDEDAEGISKNL